MSHLSETELVDAVEGRLPPARFTHVEGCDRCRDAAERLRAALALAAGDEVPEPSPLFWTHFRARVAEAVRAEPIAPAVPSWRAWLLYGVPATAAAVIAIVLALVPPERAHVAPPPDARTATVLTADTPPVAGDDLDADAAWAVVLTAAEDIDWDEARAAGLQASPGAADRMALELTEAERIELMRIVEHEMKRSGA